MLYQFHMLLLLATAYGILLGKETKLVTKRVGKMHESTKHNQRMFITFQKKPNVIANSITWGEFRLHT